MELKIKPGADMWDSDKASYSVQLDGGDHKEELNDLEKQISALSTKRSSIMRKIAEASLPGKGWEISSYGAAPYGCVAASYSRDIKITERVKKEISPLEAALKVVDAKTLFHSNILTREEKRKLIGLDATGGANGSA